MQKSKIISVAASVAALGFAAIAPAAYASTINLTDGIVINASDDQDVCVSAGAGSGKTPPTCDADVWDEERGYGLDTVEYAALLGELATNPDSPITINGSIDDIRGLLTKLGTSTANAAINTANDNLVAAMENVPELVLNVDGDAEITPNDLFYVSYLANLAGNTNQKLTVNVDGDVTFGPADPVSPLTASDTIASQAQPGSTISATGTITIPNGSGDNIAGFLGAAVVKAGSNVVSDGVTYTAAAGNTFVVKLDSPETGFAKNILAASILPVSATVVLLAGISLAVKRFSKR
ncbi:MAG: hypothetical protein LBH36_00030 [Candidatus Nomurabacteria bacterium]|jgi:hypothetical protein|nr:hypothetical protein [Candidatus Nomurabacteria bacterium]